MNFLTYPMNSNLATTLKKELAKVINSRSVENGSDTPDFILAEYLVDCLKSFEKAIVSRHIYDNVPERKAIREKHENEDRSLDAEFGYTPETLEQRRLRHGI